MNHMNIHAFYFSTGWLQIIGVLTFENNLIEELKLTKTALNSFLLPQSTLFCPQII